MEKNLQTKRAFGNKKTDIKLYTLIVYIFDIELVLFFFKFIMKVNLCFMKSTNI